LGVKYKLQYKKKIYMTENIYCMAKKNSKKMPPKVDLWWTQNAHFHRRFYDGSHSISYCGNAIVFILRLLFTKSKARGQRNTRCSNITHKKCNDNLYTKNVKDFKYKLSITSDTMWWWKCAFSVHHRLLDCFLLLSPTKTFFNVHFLKCLLVKFYSRSSQREFECSSSLYPILAPSLNQQT
jgi:hypothetical protein